MKNLVAPLVALMVLLAPPGAEAQISLGGQASRASNRFDDSQAGVGVKAALGLPAVPVEVQGSFDYFFPDCGEDLECDFWELNGNVVLRLPLVGAPLRPYGGLGLAFQRISVDDASLDATGASIIAGFELGATPVIRPFVEVRYEIIDERDEAEGLLLDNQWVLSAGLMF